MKKAIALIAAALILLTAPAISRPDVRVFAGHGEAEGSFGG